ncbi:chemotaxis protein CheB [Litoreibacter roseus]|uniref:Chemotaxis protein CheR n=1 Tax=Litoreibacter roseus TaxID=2601869 RepID=A0A6N6JHQ9_9RHOB|nr:chemotaxis protein CheB [Litoreibacter roseus]GFE65654.1 chemotaxis protein CheR [Litoreibacter roseus]
MNDNSVVSSVASALQIVGIGASAGGLEALQGFIAGLPSAHNFAFVVVQHLDPDQESLLAELLSKRTETPVVTVGEKQKIEAQHIYLIAPGQSLTIKDGMLISTEFEHPRGRRRPIDALFESLAADQKSEAVAIVLSGTGSDGSNGVKAVKEGGGLVFVQEPEEAKYDGMPRSAIETSAYDLVLPVGEMVSALNDYFANMDDVEVDTLTSVEFLERVTKHIRYRTGHDFSSYKPATLLRRIAVRMSVLGISDANSYIRRLVENSDEASRLFKDILINVTSFFRDPDVFEALQADVIPKLVEGRGRDQEIRVWVPGCSTGQEAYTIGMLISEALERTEVAPQVSIFGTDIDDDALRVARLAQYPNTIADEIPGDLLAKYFRSRSDGYEVGTALRDMVRFSNQSLCKDPPFARIDLISCRNVLIYFSSEMQKSAMRVFQYALKPGGHLLLGTSESLTGDDNLFEESHRAHRIFTRRPGPSVKLNLPRMGGFLPQQSPMGRDPSASSVLSEPFAEAILTDFAPPFLFLSHIGDLVYASDAAAKYLKMKGGSAKLSITKLIRPELEPTVRRLINTKLAPGDVTSLYHEGEIDGKVVRLEVSRKLLNDDQQLLVLKDHYLSGGQDERPLLPEGDASRAYTQELELELDNARQTIRTTIEELETSNEELKSSNEEMMSMNEELQSANEELTTSNDELNSKILEIRDINADLSGLIESTQIATVFLDSSLKLRRFTPDAKNLFRFAKQDIGRALSDIGSSIDIDRLIEICSTVSERGMALEEEFEDKSGENFYRVRVVPYRSDKVGDGGVVFTCIDITELRQYALEAERNAELVKQGVAEIEELYRVTPQAMALLDHDLRYIRVNPGLAEINGTSVEAHMGKRMDDIVPGLREQVNRPAISVFETGVALEGLRVTGYTAAHPEDERIWDTDWYPVVYNGVVSSVGVNVRDVTEQVRTAAELKRVMHELQHRVKNMLSNVMALVSRTERIATADKPLLEDLSKRLEALAQTHQLLTRSNWTSAPLLNVLEPELTAVYGTDRVTLKGRNFPINSRAALSLGMAVHELATNAAKYGAFSNDTGHVELSWVRQDDGTEDVFIFTWKERGGPTVTKPDGAGFGTTLISSTIEGSLRGKVKMSWEPAGVSCVLTINADELEEKQDDGQFNLFEN